MLVEKMLEAHSFLEWIEVFALQILDDRDFETRTIVGVAHDRRDRRESRCCRGAPAALARDKFELCQSITGGQWPNDDRDEHAEFGDRSLEFPERF